MAIVDQAVQTLPKEKEGVTGVKRWLEIVRLYTKPY